MTRKALRSEQWCTEERAAESSTDSCSCLAERALLTLKLLLKLLELLRHKLNDVLKLMELLRDDLKQLLKLLKHLVLLQLEILHLLKLLRHELERLLRDLLLPWGYAISLRAVRRRPPELRVADR
ncbi:MAG TPA: hypothetical protein VKB34_15370 [Povalibacter sp.]|nr:hypothetical protein [Povalibacter sp.]